MKGNHAEPPAGGQQPRPRLEGASEGARLVVHGHAHGLERARRDVQSPRPGPAGHRRPHRGDEIAGGGERTGQPKLPSLYDKLASLGV